MAIAFPTYGTTKSVNHNGVMNEVVVFYTDGGKDYLVQWDQLDEHDRGVLVEMMSMSFANTLPLSGGADDLKGYVIPEKQQSYFDTYRYLIKAVPAKPELLGESNDSAAVYHDGTSWKRLIDDAAV